VDACPPRLKLERIGVDDGGARPVTREEIAQMSVDEYELAKRNGRLKPFGLG